MRGCEITLEKEDYLIEWKYNLKKVKLKYSAWNFNSYL